MKTNIEKLDKNVFKFTFGDKEDKDSIFKGRPWSLNGAHLILKEWASNKSLKEVSFHYSTFNIQIHGLPPMLIHEGMARKVEETVGKVHPESINKKCIVANRFLRVKLDILVQEPLPAGFF